MKLFKATITALLGLAIAMSTIAKEDVATPNVDQIKERGTLRGIFLQCKLLGKGTKPKRRC